MAESKKDKIVTLLLVILLICTITFAVLYNSVQSDVGYTTHDNWDVQVSSVSSSKTVGESKNIDIEATCTNAVVNFTMAKPGDSITYKIKNINAGTLDAVLDSILIVGNSDDITYDISGVIIGSRLSAGGTDNIIVTFKNNSTEEKEIQERIAIIFNYR